MFVTIHKAPTAEQIAAFAMKPYDDDMYMNYRIDLSALDKAKQTKLFAEFGINAEKALAKGHVTLTYTTEI
ncbi:MAG: hypothetical protein KU37_07145 [Sulfuricurvum sp. PC08-66]|nr:MAG: hypothetical protein KU37_07145 [Sulfuricurvum sp. PC08-66]